MSEPNFRFAIMATLVRQTGDVGKIQLQKLLYFLQTSLGVPLDYHFVMHHYGPYCVQIDDNLTILRAIEAANVTADEEGYGYHITPGKRDIAEVPGWVQLVRQHEESIARLGEAFKDYPAWRLELAATVHYVHSLKPQLSLGELVEAVGQLKPKFTENDIRSAYQDLVSLRLMDTVATS